MVEQSPAFRLTMTVTEQERSLPVPHRFLLSDVLRKELDEASVTRGCQALQGNTCRCTGHTRIIQAVADAAVRVNREVISDA